MLRQQPITLYSIIKRRRLRVMFTWFLVLIENILMILLPLFIGYSIDGILNQNLQPLMMFTLILFCLVIISVARRFYDTRVYGDIRVELANIVERNLRSAPLSVKDARLTMSRELVDFLEEDLPSLLTALVQLVATVLILATFHINLALCVLAAGVTMLLIYSLFHQTFTRLNSDLNDQLEQQVRVLSSQPISFIRQHFKRLKRCEISLSDTEACVYGLIFVVLFSAVLANLWMVSILVNPSVGEVFSIVTYSLEYVETAVMLPITLQIFSRLTEINHRLSFSCRAVE